jgi:hypothetical protein
MFVKKIPVILKLFYPRWQLVRTRRGQNWK